MDRTTRHTFAQVSFAGLGLLVCLGCGRDVSSPTGLDASGPLKTVTTGKGDPRDNSGSARSRRDFAAPGLLTETEVAAAAPLLPPAAPCEYQSPTGGQSAVSLLRNPGPAAPLPNSQLSSTPQPALPLYSSEYDETQVWKGAQSGPPATISSVEANRAQPWIGGLFASPYAQSQPAASAPPIAARPSPLPAALQPAHVPADRVAELPPYRSEAAGVVNSGPSSPLPWSKLRAGGPELDTARRQADETVRRGFALAERGALFSAESEFIQTLRDLAQALDAAQDTSSHTQSLALGLRAVQEAEDFQPKGSRIETQLPMAVLIASHQTPLLKNAPANLTPQQAKQQYQAYAQEQMAVALGNEPIGSLALFALAKVQTAIDSKKPSDSGAGLARAMTYHRAALLVEPNNFLAANDLGVLLARQGRWNEARAVLEHSLAISPQVATWQNLAAVHQNLNQMDLARQSQQQAELLAQRQSNGAARGSVAVQWLDAANFAQTSANGAIDSSSPANPHAPARVAQKQNAASEDKRAGSATSTTRN